MLKTTGRGEVELISCSTRGFAVSVHKTESAVLETINEQRFVFPFNKREHGFYFYYLILCFALCLQVSFGSLIGFLPYRNLATKWKFLAFESWLRNKGVDPATYRKHLGIIGIFDATSGDPEKFEGEISPHMKLEDLLAIYDQEKLEYLSAFVGQV